MGGLCEIIASFLDAQAIDQFVVIVAPVFIGDGIPVDRCGVTVRCSWSLDPSNALTTARCNCTTAWRTSSPDRVGRLPSEAPPPTVC